jgi:DNA-binding LytR/AlgR family response regulator
MMRTLIIEDEPLARRRLVKLLNDNFKDIEIVGQEDSVAGSIAWLKRNPDGCDVIFMDVEPAPKFPIEVSRTRVDDFLKWMEE